MASEIALVIWTDAAADPSVAHSLAAEAAASVHRATGLASAVAYFGVRAVEPSEVAAAEHADWTVVEPEVVPAEEHAALQDAYDEAVAELSAIKEAVAAEKAEAKPARKPRAKKPAAPATDA